MITGTRRALHAVAEQVLAGPQYRTSGTIRLTITDEGFGTVAEPALAVTAHALLTPGGPRPLDGATCRSLGLQAGVTIGPPLGLYADYTDVGADEPLRVDAAAAASVIATLRRGDGALRSVFPDLEPVLWPEHFDVALSTGDVNYGISPGDAFLDEPYAYVGPWTARTGAFWNAPFGAARPLRDLPGPRLIAFLTEGRDRAVD